MNKDDLKQRSKIAKIAKKQNVRKPGKPAAVQGVWDFRPPKTAARKPTDDPRCSPRALENLSNKTIPKISQTPMPNDPKTSP